MIIKTHDYIEIDGFDWFASSRILHKQCRDYMILITPLRLSVQRRSLRFWLMRSVVLHVLDLPIEVLILQLIWDCQSIVRCEAQLKHNRSTIQAQRRRCGRSEVLHDHDGLI